MLPPEQQARIELELATVNELADREGTAHLLAAASKAIPPEHIPGGAPLALWFLLHQTAIFRSVFLHHEIAEAEGWRTARIARGISLADLPAKAEALSRAVRDYFAISEGSGRFCAVDAGFLDGTYSFAAQVADRLQLVEGFTERGEATVQRLRPAVPLLFLCDPASGTVLLKCHLRSAERIRSLFECFATAVLQSPIESIADVFDLDVLKRPFHPLPDGDGIEGVRVKSLALLYPERLGRRKVMLDTLSNDAPTAMDELLAEHLRDEALAEELRVCYAELQVRLRTEGGVRNYLIFLWPDRCSLDQSALGKHLHSCLRRWGIAHAV
jgi:hypothetical protein